MMMDQGIRIDSIDVNVSSDFHQAMSDAQQQEGNSKKRGRQGRGNPDEPNQNEVFETGLRAGHLWYKAGMLDLVA